MVVETMPFMASSSLRARARVAAQHGPWRLYVIPTTWTFDESMDNHRASGISAEMGNPAYTLQGPYVLLTNYGTAGNDSDMFSGTVEETIAQWVAGGWEVITSATVEAEPFASWVKTSPWRDWV